MRFALSLASATGEKMGDVEWKWRIVRTALTNISLWLLAMQTRAKLCRLVHNCVMH
jgi:hypothetical protein